MFEKAKLYSASGSTEREKALSNRRKTAVVVEELDTRMLKSIDEKKKSFTKISPESSALKRAKKEAYFQVTKKQCLQFHSWPEKFKTSSPKNSINFTDFFWILSIIS